MINLLRSELYKLLKSKSFYICSAICVAGILITTFTLLFLQKTMSPQMLEQMNQASGNGVSTSISTDVLSLDLTGQLLLSQSFTGNTLQIVLAVFISLFVASEFSNGTIQNIVSKGFSRMKIYIAKLLTVWFASLLMMILCALTSVIIGTILSGFGEVTSGFAKNLFIFFGLQTLLCFALASLFVTIALSVRSNGGSIATNVCLVAFASLVTTLIDAILPDGKTVSQYWIQNNIIEVSTFTFTAKDITQSLIISCSYFTVFVLLGALVFKQKDIK